jgi:hypothetical protein
VQDALVENRTREVEKKLKDAEKLLKEQKLKAYINPELAAVEKEKGNALVKEGKYVEAKVCRQLPAQPLPRPHFAPHARSHARTLPSILPLSRIGQARSGSGWQPGGRLLGCVAA